MIKKIEIENYINKNMSAINKINRYMKRHENTTSSVLGPNIETIDHLNFLKSEVERSKEMLKEV